MPTLDKNTFEKLIRWVDPQRDFDNIDLGKGTIYESALYGAVLAVKFFVRGGIGGALLGTAISYVTDGKINEGADLGAKIGIGIDATTFSIRLIMHPSNRPQD